MLLVSIIIMVVGAAFLFAESVTPGFAVFGVTGIILLVVSAVLTLFYVEYGIILVCVEFGFLAAGVVLFIRRAKSKKMYSQLILNESLKEDKDSIIDYSVYLGKSGVAKTSLRPAGTALINGETVEVVSDGAYIPENAGITAKEIKAGKLIVTRNGDSGNDSQIN